MTKSKLRAWAVPIFWRVLWQTAVPLRLPLRTWIFQWVSPNPNALAHPAAFTPLTMRTYTSGSVPVYVIAGAVGDHRIKVIATCWPCANAKDPTPGPSGFSNWFPSLSPLPPLASMINRVRHVHDQLVPEYVFLFTVIVLTTRLPPAPFPSTTTLPGERITLQWTCFPKTCGMCKPPSPPLFSTLPHLTARRDLNRYLALSSFSTHYASHLSDIHPES